MAADLKKLLRDQAQRQKQDAKKILADDKGAQGRRRLQAPSLTGLKNIQGEEEEVRAFFTNVDDDNIAVELQRFMNSKAIWKGRRSFFQRFMGLVPEEHYVHFKEHYLNQDLDFKQYFDTVYKPEFVDTDIFNSGKYDEILRELFNRYLTLPPSQYQQYEDQLLESIPDKAGRFNDMLNIFKDDINDNEKRKFAQLFIENNLPFEDFYLKYMGGDFDVAAPRDGGKVEEPVQPRIQRRPLIIDEQGNVVGIPTHNLYKFEGPRNRLPIVSREQFRKKIEEGEGIPTQVIELAKIELKTNLNLPNNNIDDIIIGLTEKFRRVNKFILKLGEIILYYVNNFVIKNQGNRIASLYRDRVENNLINFRNLSYAKKADFLPELFQFKDGEEVSINMVKNFIGRQLEIFMNNFKNKLYVYITNVTAKAKNIHIGINSVAIVSNVDQTDYFMFGYTNSSGENVYFDIRNKPANLPKKLAKKLAKVYSLRLVGSAPAVAISGVEDEEPDEVIDIEEIYNMFVQSLDDMDVEMPEESGSSSQSSGDSSASGESEQGESEVEEEGGGEGESEVESETSERSKSEGNEEMKNKIRLLLRQKMSDMIRRQLTIGREEKNLPPLGKAIVDKMINSNSANIEKTITKMIEEYEADEELDVLLNPNIKTSWVLEYLKPNMPDVFEVESEGEEEEENPKKVIRRDESEEETKPSRGIFSSSEGEEEKGSESERSDSPNRSCKCIKCGKETSQNLKTKIKDGNEFKTVCFCSFKCFEKFKK